MSESGQTEKNSVRADVFRSSPAENGHPRERPARSSALRQERSFQDGHLFGRSPRPRGYYCCWQQLDLCSRLVRTTRPMPTTLTSRMVSRIDKRGNLRRRYCAIWLNSQYRLSWRKLDLIIKHWNKTRKLEVRNISLSPCGRGLR